MVVLGISIGTRVNGIAILDNSELVIWQSHAFPTKWSQTKLKKIVSQYEKYIHHHNVSVVIVKIPRMSHLNKSLKILLSKLASLVKFRGCMLDYTTLTEIKARVPKIENSYDLQDYTLSQYPVLLPEHARERVNKRPYHHKMFEAVLIAHLWKEDHQH